MVRGAGFARRPHHEDQRRHPRPSILVLRRAEGPSRRITLLTIAAQVSPPAGRITPGAIGPQRLRRLDLALYRGEARPCPPLVIERRQPIRHQPRAAANVAAAGFRAPAAEIAAETPQADAVRAEAQGLLHGRVAVPCRPVLQPLVSPFFGTCQKISPDAGPRGRKGSPRGGGAPIGADRLVSCPLGHAAPRGAPHAHQQRSGSACYLRRLIGIGARFLAAFALWPEGRCTTREKVREARVRKEHFSASSWRGLLVVLGGAPIPPECFTACEARRRRIPSRDQDAS